MKNKAVTIFILISTLTSISAQAVDIYVSMSAGSDANTGSAGKPFKTIARARQEARKYMNPFRSDVNIKFRAGTYYFDTPLTLTNVDGGTDKFKIKYSAYNNEKVVFSGGRAITSGWQQHKDYNTNHIWQIDLSKKNIRDPDKPNAWFVFRQLWVNGKKAKRARCDISITAPQTPAKESDRYKLSFRNDANGKKIVSATHKEDVELWTFWQWMANIVKINTITSKYELIIKEESPYYIGFQSTPERPQINIGVENAFEFLDEPGEWFYNKYNNYLYYYPEGGRDPTTSEIIFPILQQIVKASGLSNVEFNGITFSHGTWTYPNDHGYITGQGSIFVEYVAGKGNIHHVVAPANIEFSNSSRITISNCSFVHLGAEALCFQNGSANNLINKNTFEDVAGTGIRIGNGLDFNHNDSTDMRRVTYKNTISNNIISNVANEYRSHCGIWLGFVNNNKVIKNKLSNLPYTGISTGYPAPPGTGALLGANTIDNNEISNVLTTLRDGGAIYNHAQNYGQSYIRNNIICGIKPITEGNDRAGIYLDQGSSNFVVSGNRGNLNFIANNKVIQYLTFTNFANGTEKNNVFKNNVFTKCK